MAGKQKMVLCRHCDSAIPKKAKVCPSCGKKNKKPFYKRWWFIFILIIVVWNIIIGQSGGEKTEEIVWEDMILGDMLPKPKADKGRIVVNSDENMAVYIADTSEADYMEYKSACEEMGYVIEAEHDSSTYHAFHSDGYELRLWHSESSEELKIELKAPMELEESKEDIAETVSNEPETEEETTEPATTEPETEEETEPELVDGLRPEFIEAMDKYEEFMDEYCDFMTAYSKSDGTDLKMLASYADYMKKYAEVVKAFEKWEDEEMNDAETLYYIDVQTRINKKLLEVNME